jgi:hypothetical protein
MISIPEKGGNPQGSVYTSVVHGLSEKFKLIVNRYNIKTFFKTKDMKIRPERDAQQTHTGSECGRSYTGETHLKPCGSVNIGQSYRGSSRKMKNSPM